MQMTDIVGYAGACLTTFALLPQIIRIVKLKEARDVSPLFPLMTSAGNLLWLIYGIMLGETPIVIANIVSLLFALSTLFVAVRYR